MNHRLLDHARQHGNALLRLLLPGACALCGGACDDALCRPCAAQFFGDAAAIARCPCCANPLPAPAGLRCGACLAAPPAFDATVVAADYALPVDQLVLQLKFGHRLALAPLLARLLRDAVLRQAQRTAGAGYGGDGGDDGDDGDDGGSGAALPALPALLCPVPLGRLRLAERGYNQALEIARPLARSLGVALAPRLAARTRDTAAQSGVAPEQRQQNIAGAFAIATPALVRGRHIGVVDDVMTSGRTLHELAATLKRHGAARVSNFVFARTPPH